MRLVCTIVIALALAACGNGATPSPTGLPVTSPPSATPPGLTAPATSQAATPLAPALPPRTAPGTTPSAVRTPTQHGTAVILTRTLAGTLVPQVPIELRRIEPCDPAKRDDPLPSQVTSVHKSVTGADGRAMLDLPLGCYRFTMTPPPGTSPVPEGMHTLHLAKPGEEVYGELRFNDSTPRGGCDAAQIAPDLDLYPHLITAKATVSLCNGYWAVIVWDVMGDSQRIVRYVGGKWTTYVAFPHRRCWAQALADGIPAMYRPYFSDC